PGEDDEPAGSALPAPGPDPESASIGADEQRTLERLIAALPDEHREVLLLREMEEMSYREIAAVTGLPIGTVMSRLARARAGRRTRPFWLGALGSLGAALAAGAAVLLLMPVRPDPMLDEIVTAHVRSLMPEHLTDVVSTDRHTVKPWFAGHADVSPVVADFAPEGYRLVGGRADYFERQRAAAVVYQHGAHVINVFAWVAGRDALPAAATRSGYHLAFWRVGNLEYCAVSDAGWDELRRLERLLRDLGAREQMP